MATQCECCDLVDKHDEELYRGNGTNPGLITRVALAEDRIKGINELAEQINKRFWTIILGIAGTCTLTLIDILLKK